jgi:hypothetical protein
MVFMRRCIFTCLISLLVSGWTNLHAAVLNVQISTYEFGVLHGMVDVRVTGPGVDTLISTDSSGHAGVEVITNNNFGLLKFTSEDCEGDSIRTLRAFNENTSTISVSLFSCPMNLNQVFVSGTVLRSGKEASFAEIEISNDYFATILHRAYTDEKGIYGEGFEVTQSSGVLQMRIKDCRGIYFDTLRAYSMGDTVKQDFNLCSDEGTTYLGGVIHKGQTPVRANEATVELYKFDEPEGDLKFVTSGRTNSAGQYQFAVDDSTEYLVKAYSSSNLSFFAPSYYGGTMYWNKATLVRSSASYSRADIFMPFTIPSYGECSLAGYVYSAKNDTHSKIAAQDLTVILLNEEYDAVSVIKTRQDGGYKFENIDTGIYYLLVDIAGLPTDPQKIYVNTRGSITQAAEILINHAGVTYGTYTSTLSRDEELNNLRVYPNPFSDYINVEGPSTGSIMIYGLNGKVIYDNKGEHKIDRINTQDLPQGAYIIQITTQNNSNTPVRYRIIKGN